MVLPLRLALSRLSPLILSSVWNLPECLFDPRFGGHLPGKPLFQLFLMGPLVSRPAEGSTHLCPAYTLGQVRAITPLHKREVVKWPQGEAEASWLLVSVPPLCPAVPLELSGLLTTNGHAAMAPVMAAVLITELVYRKCLAHAFTLRELWIWGSRRKLISVCVRACVRRSLHVWKPKEDTSCLLHGSHPQSSPQPPSSSSFLLNIRWKPFIS